MTGTDYPNRLLAIALGTKIKLCIFPDTTALMNLKQTVDTLYSAALSTPASGLETIAQAEHYLNQAYEGRYLLELIQNVRDANKKLEQTGKIFINLTGDILTIANSGAEFNEKGIDAITTIGRSDKQSQDLIGFKGIGFKSVQAISDTPKIVTRYGSVAFDRSRTAKDLPDFDEEDLPLFYCPHYDEIFLTKAELDTGIVTKIVLKLKPSVNEAMVSAAYKKIKVNELVVLGHIEDIIYQAQSSFSAIRINQEANSPILSVIKDGQKSKFKSYSPLNRLVIPEAAIASLSRKEQKLFKQNPTVEVKIVMEVNEKSQTVLKENTKLYLFYPLEIGSGFRFIIHSFFMVDPERKSLRNNEFNKVILSGIADYLADELLPILISKKANVTRLLTFVRQPDENLKVLYDQLIDRLKKKKFLFDPATRKYHTVDQVIIADDFDNELFPERKLGGRQLIHLEDRLTRDWLMKEFGVKYLDYNKIEQEIEAECKRQLKEKNVKFFQHLYNYVASHAQLNLTGKKVLLTDQWKLVSSADNVLYGGSRQKALLPASLKRAIHFIHKDIIITDFREGSSRTGIIEYSTYQLVRRLLKLMRPDGHQNLPILNLLFQLDLDTKSKLEIQEKVLLPVKGFEEWKYPIYHCLYLESPELRTLYPDGHYVAETALAYTEDNEVKAKFFLKLCGAWDIPGVYVSKKSIYTQKQQHRERQLIEASGLTSTPFRIDHDRLLDQPKIYNDWFTNAIIDNWSHYHVFVNSDHLARIQFSNTSSNLRNVNTEFALNYSGFLETLINTAWITFKGETDSYKPAEVIGIEPNDFYKPTSQVIKRHLKLLPLPFETKRGFLKLLKILHFDGDTLNNFTGLLTSIYEKYRNEILDSRDFPDFYNRLLNKLFEFYYYRNSETIDITLLKKQWFLAQDEVSGNLEWKKGEEIFFIDDRPNYDILPSRVKDIVQPQFTLNNKQTFGKIAAKIGKKFSKSITRALIQDSDSTQLPLIEYFPELPASIALMEYLTEKALGKELDTIKNTIVREHQSLRISVKVADTPAIEIITDYFVDQSENYVIHVKSDLFTSKNKLIAEAINALFTEILGKETRRYSIELQRYLNSENRKAFLRECEITQKDIQDIQEQLYTVSITNQQKFWISVLDARSIHDRTSVQNPDGINQSVLAKNLKIEERLLTEFSESFNFNNTSATGHIQILQKMMIATGITLAQLNEFLYPKIDFRFYYTKQLSQLKNQFENIFNAKLFRYLQTKKSNVQQNYLASLDQYRTSFDVSCPVDIIIDDIDGYFILLIKDMFPKMDFSIEDLRTKQSKINFNEIYLEKLVLLKNSLTKIGMVHTEEQIRQFSAILKWGSLLYFDQALVLINGFRSWLEVQNAKTKVNLPDNHDNLLDEIEIREDEIIEDVSTKSVPQPGRGGNGSGGKTVHYDGSANDAQRHKIGIAAEMVAYHLLSKKFEEVYWVSKNASKAPETHPGFNPQGDDNEGYDIEYLDNQGNKHFVEVKGRGEFNESFDITRAEIMKSYQAGELYEVILITNTLDTTKRKVHNLGNPFMLERGYDFFSNNKFTAIYKSFEIRFHINEK